MPPPGSNVGPKWAIPDDWNQEQDGYISVLFCVPNSQKWRGLVTGLIHSLSYGRLWNGQTGNIKDTQAIGLEIFESMQMGCIEELNINMDRIATALENIDQKTSLLYTWDELIEDIETAFGTGSLIYNLINGIIGLMPNLKAKVDMTWFARAIWEYMTWKAPLKTMLAAIVAAQTAQATAAAAGKIMDIINTVMGGIGILQTTALGWKDIIFGDKSIWEDLVTPIWDWFTDDPPQSDIDPELRLSQLYQHSRNVILTDMADSLRHANQLTIDCVCGRPFGVCMCGGGGQMPIIIIVTEGGDPPDGWDTPAGAPDEGLPGQPEYYSRKCAVANRLHEDVVNYITQLDSINIVSQVADSMFSLLQSILSMPSGDWPIIGIVSGTVWGWVVAVQNALAQTGVDLSGLLADLEANDSALVCALYSAGDVSEARAGYTDILSTAGTPAIDIDIVGLLLSNDALSYLFFANDQYVEAKIANYTPPIDCSVCGECEEIYFGYGTRNGGDIFESEALSGQYAGEHRISFIVNYDGSDACDNTLNLTFSNWTGFTGVVYNERQGFAISDDLNHNTNDGDSYEVVNTNTPPASQQYDNCRLIIIVSSTAFSVDITGFSS